MDTVTVQELKQWAGPQAGPVVSIYLPTHPGGEAGMQDPIRLKNLLQQASARLEAAGLRPADVHALLAPATRLETDSGFWKQRRQGLALLLTSERAWTLRLPVVFAESVTVGPRLNIKPLLAAADRGERFLLLVLSQNQVKLWEVTRGEIRQLAVKGLPAGLREALNIEDADRGEQVHAAMRGNRGKQAAVFHGQGGEKDTAKSDITQYFRAIDRALAPLLHHETAPLLLAGVDYLLPIFRQLTAYPHLAERHLSGNCDSLTARQLQERGWELMRPYFDRPRRQALDRLRQWTGTDKVSLDPTAIVTAAYSGKIEVLLTDPNQQRPGRFEPQLGQALACDAACPESEDLVNLAVAETLLHGGTVYPADSCDLPAETPDAAIFRY